MAHPFVELAKEAGCTVKQLDVLRLSIEGYSQGYIAEAIGVTHNSTVQEHYAAGVKRLRAYCDENGITPDTLRYWGLDTDKRIQLNGKDPYIYKDGLDPAIVREEHD